MRHWNMMTLGWKCRTRAAPSCDIFNLGFIIFQCPLTTVHRLFLAVVRNEKFCCLLTCSLALRMLKTWPKLVGRCAAALFSVRDRRLHHVLLEPRVLPRGMRRHHVRQSQLRHDGAYIRVVCRSRARLQAGRRQIRLATHRGRDHERPQDFG